MKDPVKYGKNISASLGDNQVSSSHGGNVNLRPGCHLGIRNTLSGGI